ncbi:MAG: GTPase Era [Armatimonadetes bacterium]|nr:GTPase Era [Armatimonadota bacterium]
MSAYRAGVVAVVGKPNVGKSTLVNTLVGHKVSIVSDKAQTTRKRILGIHTRGDCQIVFADTPGLHSPKHRLGQVLNETVRQSLDGVDVVLVVVDVSKHPGKADQNLASLIEAMKGKVPFVLCMNKMDLLKPIDVTANYEAYIELFGTEHNMLTSFSKLQNVDKLVAMIVEQLPEGPPLYPEDHYTDQSVRSLASEFVREKALRLTRKEVPHAVHTYVENWEERDDLARISVVVLVETEGQKAILIGKGGAMLKRIGTESRQEIEELLDKKVFIELFVKVRADWRQSARMLQELEIV